MKYSFLLLILCVFFSYCKEANKESSALGKTFSLEKVFKAVREVDTACRLLDFEPDTGYFALNTTMFEEFYPEKEYGLKGNYTSVSIKELSPQPKGIYLEVFSKKHFFENGRQVKVTNSDSSNSYIETARYGATGLVVERKTVYPLKNDSSTMVYHYDLDKKLKKIVQFDGRNSEVQTFQFFYHANGNLDSMNCTNGYEKMYQYKYFSNSASKSYVKVRLDQKGKIIFAGFYVLAGVDQVVYDEHYEMDFKASISHNHYLYDDYGNLKQMDVVTKPYPSEVNFKFSYTKVDSAGSWVEMLTYMDRDLFGITKRTITYK